LKMIRTACAAVLLLILAGSPLSALHCLGACLPETAPSCHGSEDAVTWSSAHDCDGHDQDITSARTPDIRHLTNPQAAHIAASHVTADDACGPIERRTAPHTSGDLAPPSSSIPLRI